jgi:hypothetical protein
MSTDPYGMHAAAIPMPVTVGVVGLPCRAVVVDSIHLDHNCAAVAEHHEVRGTHPGVAQLGCRQGHHRESSMPGARPLEIDEQLVYHYFGPTAEREPILHRVAAVCSLTPGLIAR